MRIFDKNTNSWKHNPAGKFSYGSKCVKQCPKKMVIDNGACVKKCSSKKYLKMGECFECNGPCPKVCKNDGAVDSNNIEKFKDCNIIEGSIEIQDVTFEKHTNYKNETIQPFHPDRLEVFSSLREITGLLKVEAIHESFTSLSYFRNLEVIGGHETMQYLMASLFILRVKLWSLC